MQRVVHRTCPLCEACCGLRVAVEGDRVAGIRGDPDDPLSRGAPRPGAGFGRERPGLRPHGESVQPHGVTCHWSIQVLNLVTGNVDRPGGVMFSAPALDPVARGIAPAWGLGRWNSRVRGLPGFGGELPVATLADELLTPGPGRVRALVTLAGNPVLSTPDGPGLERALDELDFVVSVDGYVNETSRHADLILPPVSPLEREHYDLMWNQLAVRNVAKWSPRVFDPPPGALDDWQILSALTRRLARGPKRKVAASLKGASDPAASSGSACAEDGPGSP